MSSIDLANNNLIPGNDPYTVITPDFNRHKPRFNLPTRASGVQRDFGLIAATRHEPISETQWVDLKTRVYDKLLPFFNILPVDCSESSIREIIKRDINSHIGTVLYVRAKKGPIYSGVSLIEHDRVHICDNKETLKCFLEIEKALSPEIHTPDYMRNLRRVNCHIAARPGDALLELRMQFRRASFFDPNYSALSALQMNVIVNSLNDLPASKMRIDLLRHGEVTLYKRPGSISLSGKKDFGRVEYDFISAHLDRMTAAADQLYKFWSTSKKNR